MSANIEEIKKIIREVVLNKARKQAFKIMSAAFEKDIIDFINYYKKGDYNAVCATIDYAKWNLVKANKLKHKKKDHFGSPFL